MFQRIKLLLNDRGKKNPHSLGERKSQFLCHVLSHCYRYLEIWLFSAALCWTLQAEKKKKKPDQSQLARSGDW